MRKNTTCSLVISTYNAPARLKRCLQSVMRQRLLPTEILIADDGSGIETSEIVKEMKQYFQIPLIHIWHPDKGFRLASIRNKAISQAKGEYIINVDGDVLLDKNFIYDHVLFAHSGCFIAGVRTLLMSRSTEKYMNESAGFPSFYSSFLKKRSHAFRCFLFAKLYHTFRHTQNPYFYVVGCNMAFWKEDLLLVNGYNEVFEGWGMEDNDIALRLINAGVKLRFLQFAAIVFHLYHPENDRSGILLNNKTFQQDKMLKLTYVPNGIDKHIKKTNEDSFSII